MPKAFLVRKNRTHCRWGPGGTVTPPPSPEQTFVVVSKTDCLPDDSQCSADSWQVVDRSRPVSHTPPISPPPLSPERVSTTNYDPKLIERMRLTITSLPVRLSSLPVPVIKSVPMQPPSPDSDNTQNSEDFAKGLHPTLSSRISELQQRLGLPSDVSLEFVNGGHGIKNPMLRSDEIRDDSIEDHKQTNKTSDDSRFNCQICGKTFSLQRLLNRHRKCHSNMKRYLCTFCGKGFNDTFDLKRHTRTHTGVRPYKCSQCEKSFTQRCSLESHKLKVHGIQHNYAYKERRAKVYVCEECGHTTSEPEVHYIHLKENHPYSPALLKFYDKRHFKFADSSTPITCLRLATTTTQSCKDT